MGMSAKLSCVSIQCVLHAMQELFSPLACGGMLVLAAPGGEKDTQYLARLIAEQGVTFASFVPSQLDVLLQVHCSSLCFVMSALRKAVVAKHFSEDKVSDMRTLC